MDDVTVQDLGVIGKRRGVCGCQEIRAEPEAKLSQRPLVLRECGWGDAGEKEGGEGERCGRVCKSREAGEG